MPPPQGLLIDAMVAKRIQWVSQMDAWSSFPRFLGRFGDRKLSVMASTNWACIILFSYLYLPTVEVNGL